MFNFKKCIQLLKHFSSKQMKKLQKNKFNQKAIQMLQKDITSN